MDGDAQRWVGAVGVAKDHPVWVAVVRYPVVNRHRTLRLYRPTQLDAGWYPHHFPSLPGIRIHRGGFTMYSGEGFRQHGLVAEYIHAETEWSFDDWTAAAGFVGFADKPVGTDLAKLRANHWGFLRGQFGDRIVRWMPDSG